ncbi:unnamed protein product, partial [Discosporangium mesarthrocarpum]
MMEAGGLWGTYHQDTDFDDRGFPTQESEWRTKSHVDFDWGLLPPVGGIVGGDWGEANTTAEISAAAGSVGVGEGGGWGASAATPRGNASFPADYFSASFAGYVEASTTGEHTFYVSTDPSSGARLAVQEKALFDDLPLNSFQMGSEGGDGDGGGTRVSMGERQGAAWLEAGTLVPIELWYRHTEGVAWIRLEWSPPSSPSSSLASSTAAARVRTVIPKENLHHLRPGWSGPITLWPAATTPRMSNIVVPEESNGQEEEEEEDAGVRWSGGDITATAGVTRWFEVVARDAYGNHRSTGGDTVQMYAKGPDQVMIHGSITDGGFGGYMVSFWPSVAGAYRMSVVIDSSGQDELSDLQWARGYRSVEQTVAGSHVSGSPFRLLVSPGAAAPNTTLAYGQGLVSATAGAHYGNSFFIVRARDIMGNRVMTGATGDITISLSGVGGRAQSEMSAAVAGSADYVGGGEYKASYNATLSGDYALHVRKRLTGLLGAGPFSLSVAPGPASARTSICENCEGLLGVNFSANHTKVLHLSARDAFENTLVRGGEEWCVEILGEEKGIQAPLRHGVVSDRGNGLYRLPFRPG